MLDFALPRVKVCGLSRLEDLDAAVEAGAGAVGLVQHPASPRAVTALAANRLAARLPDAVLSVGVFADLPAEEVLRWARQAGVRAVQLCGSERPEDFQAFPLPVLRRLAVAGGAEDDLDSWREVAAGFVLDHPVAPGGTGLPVDLDHAAELAARAPCLLAGGLSAENVAAAITAVRPAGVDASSGLESGPGLKDPAKVRAFIAAARAAFNGRGS